MSKNIVIQEKGTSKTFQNVEVMRTNSHMGGYIDWVPEDEKPLGVLNVTDNGTYTAEGQSLYGFSAVNVNVNKVRGRLDGVEYIVSVDADGYLVYTPVEE